MYFNGGSGLIIMQSENVIEMLHITKEFPGTVSYTHLTLPTNSLV